MEKKDKYWKEKERELKSKVYKRKRTNEYYVCRSIQLSLDVYESMLEYMQKNKKTFKDTIVSALESYLYELGD